MAIAESYLGLKWFPYHVSSELLQKTQKTVVSACLVISSILKPLSHFQDEKRIIRRRDARECSLTCPVRTSVRLTHQPLWRFDLCPFTPPLVPQSSEAMDSVDSKTRNAWGSSDVSVYFGLVCFCQAVMDESYIPPTAKVRKIRFFCTHKE